MNGIWRIPDLIDLKSRGSDLSMEQVAYVVKCITEGNMEDSQLGALLMAIKLKGMSAKETIALTRAMRDSGSVLSWPSEWVVGDKHSTGGVGDKVSLPLAPALAACGLKVPMISGRGLGHTGGTLDKLESIPGFRVSLSESEVKECLETAGCCIIGQTKSIVPADQIMYATRDITATVDSQELIVGSIISKKAAENLNALVLDVKYGSGATIKPIEDAENMAKSLVKVSKSIGLNTTALLTRMDTPIGKTIGNALEIMESLDCLRNEGPADLHELVIGLGGELLANAALATSDATGREAIAKSLKDGSARKQFSIMMQRQGVSKSISEALCGNKADYSSLPKAKFITSIKAQREGFVLDMNALELAEVSLALGAGRSKANDPVNYAVGVKILKMIGDKVLIDETWAELHHDAILPESLKKKAEGAVTIDTDAPKVPPRITKRIT
ncbi:unnamed protein product [Meganyctiphanes norvegica]|uniref:Thymidine phosphorylase n=1 Tax=Meganyctiphanes norvegica TaxID=48144 RepID=A0AAV2Q042_MEGNR